MKKVIFIFVMVFNILLLTSCTDTTEELEERIELKNEKIYVQPSDDGSIDDDDYREN